MPEDLQCILECILKLQWKPDVPIANKADMATGKIDLVVPIRSMKKNTLVLVYSRNSRPLPIVQDATSINKNIAVVIDGLTPVQVLDMHIVSALGMIPVCHPQSGALF